MSDSVELIGIFASIIALGLIRGSGVCVSICAPGLVPYIADKKRNWQYGLKAGILFNIPRVLLLTVAGSVIGYFGFKVVEKDYFEDIAGVLGGLGYFFVGIIFLAIGAYMFAKAADERIDLKEGIKNCNIKKKSNVMCKIERISPKRRFIFLMWGSLMGIACIGEVTILEGGLLTGLASSYADSSSNAILIGAFAMFLFGIGSSIPILILTTATGKFSEGINTFEKLNKIKTIGSVIMIMVGLTLILKMGAFLKGTF